MTVLRLVDERTGEMLDVSVLDGKDEDKRDDKAPLPEVQFCDFWTLYPRRVARKDALKAWGRLKPAQQMAAVVACAAWRRVWATKDLDYLPYPATWINGERWDDELPPEFTQSHGSHVAAALPEPTARTVMPEHVKALLAKMRNGKG